MTADKNIRCTVVWDPNEEDRADSRVARPSDLLPWADPYIASLVRKLQREARHEATAERRREAATEPLSPWDLWDMCYDDHRDACWDRAEVVEPHCAAV